MTHMDDGYPGGLNGRELYMMVAELLRHRRTGRRRVPVPISGACAQPTIDSVLTQSFLLICVFSIVSAATMHTCTGR